MKFLNKWFTKRPAVRRQVRSSRPGLEQLEDRQLLSGTPPGLHNAVIAPVAQAEYIQDNGHLSRMDVIHLLDVVDGTEKVVFTNGRVSFTAATPTPNAALTASQLTDLQTLAQDAGPWGMAPDVTNLFGKVVNQNPANQTYQGASLLPTGQLTSGTPDLVLQDLVGKWFYGMDLPATQAAAVNNEIPGNVVYKTAEGTLFGPGGPSQNDVAQGWVGDCYFMSSLAETALQSPQTIKSMFINNGDGTYTVRFFNYDSSNGTWQPDYVTVNLQLPVMQSSGEFAFAGWYQGGKPVTYTSHTAVLWPALAEKAYAELAAEGWSRSTGPGGSGISSTPSDWNQNSYDALAEGDGVALQQITGSSFTSDVYLPTASKTDEKTLEQALAHGNLVIIGSLAQEPANVPTNAAGSPLIISGHVYSLKSVDAAGNKFTLVNPYDDNSLYPGDGQRTVTLTWAQMKAYLNDAFIVAPPPICPEHVVVQQGVNTGINGHAQAVNIQWYDNGKLISSLSQAHEGDTITVTFDTLPCAKDTEFSLVAYAAPNGDFNQSNIDHQQEWGDSTGTFQGAGHHSLTVTLPDGYFQLDFVQGAAITNFATGERYHSDDTFIAGVQGGNHVVKCC
jgi:Calpain family cysteine protease